MYTNSRHRFATEEQRDGKTYPSANTEHAIPLSRLSVGRFAVICRITGRSALRRRLLDMGLTPGTRVFLRRTAPLGDPIAITVRGYDLSLRKADAALIWVIPGTDSMTAKKPSAWSEG